MKQKYIKASDVATMFGVTRQTIRNWVSKGLLHGIMIDGTQFIHRSSLQKAEGSLNFITVMEESIEHYKESLKKLEQQHIGSIDQLRECCKGNKALTWNRQTVVKFLPVFYGLIRPELPVSDRGCKILQMLLSGDDIKTISEHFGLTTVRIQQIIEKELSDIRSDTETYRMLKEERDKLLEEVKILRINAKSYEAIKYEAKKMEKVKPSILTKDLVDCNLSVRAINCCRFGDIKTVADLVAHTKTDIFKLRCMGKKTLIELDEFITSLGLEWGKHYIVQTDGTIVEAISPTT